MEELLNLLILPGILNYRVAYKLLNSLLFVLNFKVDLFIFELVALFDEFFDGLVSLFELALDLSDIFVFGQSG